MTGAAKITVGEKHKKVGRSARLLASGFLRKHTAPFFDSLPDARSSHLLRFHVRRESYADDAAVF